MSLSVIICSTSDTANGLKNIWNSRIIWRTESHCNRT